MKTKESKARQTLLPHILDQSSASSARPVWTRPGQLSPLSLHRMVLKKIFSVLLIFWLFASACLMTWAGTWKSIFLINSSGIISDCHPPGLFSWMDCVTFRLLFFILFPGRCKGPVCGCAHRNLAYPRQPLFYSDPKKGILGPAPSFCYASDTSNAPFPLKILCVGGVNSSVFRT